MIHSDLMEYPSGTVWEYADGMITLDAPMVGRFTWRQGEDPPRDMRLTLFSWRHAVSRRHHVQMFGEGQRVDRIVCECGETCQ